MLTIDLSTSGNDIKHRHTVAIASLATISLLASLSGFHGHPAISNSWEGLLWGIADPAINLNRLVSLIAIGLLSAGMVRGALIPASFGAAAAFGMVIHLFHLNLGGAEIGIAISTIAFSAMLMIVNKPNSILLAVLGAIAGFLHGYAGVESVVDTGIIPLVIYVMAFALTQCTVLMSAREIYSILPNKITFAGLAFCAIGIVFFGNAINLI
ncbi:HupE/UreJ family protein [Tolypothrix sp. FACHB-123]|uniref:HupE/UreJ family protein n=1 Tax=Tolypothrix sp. FACHB-123 TaxID=2692868 RepID=UPI001689226E|nr:HupE/UreJ family protein [Tolypothrix sp. FACHB-123]MBD2355364.1 HupE/UreJ family protein [Tolypothrix sp. FACHB-123]